MLTERKSVIVLLPYRPAGLFTDLATLRVLHNDCLLPDLKAVGTHNVGDAVADGDRIALPFGRNERTVFRIVEKQIAEGIQGLTVSSCPENILMREIVYNPSQHICMACIQSLARIDREYFICRLAGHEGIDTGLSNNHCIRVALLPCNLYIQIEIRIFVVRLAENRMLAYLQQIAKVFLFVELR